MTQLQEIMRKNGTTVHFVYLPEDIIKALGWVKGNFIDIEQSGSAVKLSLSI